MPHMLKWHRIGARLLITSQRLARHRATCRDNERFLRKTATGDENGVPTSVENRKRCSVRYAQAQN